MPLTKSQYVKIQPGDRLSILISSKDPGLAYLYNLNIVGHYIASSSNNLSTSQIAIYTVDPNGDIDFPVVGKLHIADMTRHEIANFVKDKLISGSYLKDPTVTVDFVDLYYSVMGEVNQPGRYAFDRDKITLIDAISRSGDLTIYGRRDNVLIVREEKGYQTTYRVDLTNTQQLYSSPAFYLKQGDAIYVTPNNKRARESTGTGNAFLQPSLWISLASLTTSILLLIKK